MGTFEGQHTLRGPETHSQFNIHWHAGVWWYVHTSHCSGSGRAAPVSGDISWGRALQHLLNSFQDLTSLTLRGHLTALSWKLDREKIGWRGTTQSSKLFTYLRVGPLGQQWACPEVFSWLAGAWSHCALLILWTTTANQGHRTHLASKHCLRDTQSTLTHEWTVCTTCTTSVGTSHHVKRNFMAVSKPLWRCSRKTED